MPPIALPRLSDSMEEGTILRWLRADGDTVARGDDLVEIETDKATLTYEADHAGVLRIVAAEGERLPVGATIATIGDVEPELAAVATSASASSQAAAVPAAAFATPTTIIKASPVARRLATAHGLDVAAITGTGPHGRILKADVRAAHEAASAPANGDRPPREEAPAPAPAPREPERVSTAKGEVRVEELSQTQQVVARRMAESRATAPAFELQVSVDMTELLELRAQLKQLPAPGRSPSVNDFIVKAAAIALREFPRANGSYRDGRFELYSRVNVGIAVAGEDSLVVPTVFDADTKSVGQIARESRALVERARAARLTPPELAGGTFTVSNLGMFGIDRFSAVVNPPQAGILAVGAVTKRPVVIDDEIVVRSVADLTLACDHRILYGADAAQVLGRVRQLLQSPLTLAL